MGRRVWAQLYPSREGRYSAVRQIHVHVSESARRWIVVLGVGTGPRGVPNEFSGNVTFEAVGVARRRVAIQCG